MARIAVGGFQHETNTFAPLKATWADFERADAWPPFVRGPQLIAAVEGFNIPIAGAVLALEALGTNSCRYAGARRPLPLMSSTTPTRR
jgi:microcystin degradation protein MlrC